MRDTGINSLFDRIRYWKKIGEEVILLMQMFGFGRYHYEIMKYNIQSFVRYLQVWSKVARLFLNCHN